MMISNDLSEKNRKLLTDYQAEFNRLRKQGKKKSWNADYSSSSNGSSSSGYSSNEGGGTGVQMRRGGSF